MELRKQLKQLRKINIFQLRIKKAVRKNGLFVLKDIDSTSIKKKFLDLLNKIGYISCEV